MMQKQGTAGTMTHTATRRLTMAALFMAMNIALSSFGIPVPGGHLGGIGAFLGDFFFYPAPMFVSLVTHGLQAGMIAMLIAGGEEKRSKGRVIGALLVGAVIMVIGYSLGRAYVYSTPEYSLIKLPFEILQAMIGVVFSYILYFYTSVREVWKKHISE